MATLALGAEWWHATGMIKEKDGDRLRLQAIQRAAEKILAELPKLLLAATENGCSARMTENDPHAYLIAPTPPVGPGVVRVAWVRENRDAEKTPGHFAVSVDRANREYLAAPEVMYDTMTGEWIDTRRHDAGEPQAAVDAILVRVLEGLRRLNALAS
jgi:hypothetical protein